MRSTSAGQKAKPPLLLTHSFCARHSIRRPSPSANSYYALYRRKARTMCGMTPWWVFVSMSCEMLKYTNTFVAATDQRVLWQSLHCDKVSLLVICWLTNNAHTKIRKCPEFSLASCMVCS